MLTIRDLPKLHESIARELQLTRGAYRLNRPVTIQRRVDKQQAELEASNPAYRLMSRNPMEKERMLGGLRSDIECPLRLVAGVMRHRMREARERFRDVRETVARTR